MLVEPDAEIVQSYPGRQAAAQTLKLLRSLPPESEGVEQLVVDALHNLANASDPLPESFGPGLAAVALGRVDDLCPVALKPPPMVLGALETLIGYVRSS